jgi:hypothetical protein
MFLPPPDSTRLRTKLLIHWHLKDVQDQNYSKMITNHLPLHTLSRELIEKEDIGARRKKIKINVNRDEADRRA